MKKIRDIAIVFLLVIIQEYIFSFFAFGKVEHAILKMLFSLQIALILNICFVFKEKINKCVVNIFCIFIAILSIAQYIYYSALGGVIGVYDILKFGEVVRFTGPVLTTAIGLIIPILIMLIPCILFFVITKKVHIERNNKKQLLRLIVSLVLVYLVSILIIKVDKEEEIYSSENLYFNINNNVENLKHFGVLTTARLDIQRTIFAFKEKTLYEYIDENGNVEIIDIAEYNMTNIDFENLIENESNNEIKEIHKYLSSQQPTKKNSYTGKFKDKNLIIIVGESFSLQAINKDITPTLYKLYNESIQFDNFYTPLFPVSTADGQYLLDTSLLPAEGVWSIEEVKDKTYPYSIANVLKADGYKTFAYHNNYYDYYKRHIYFDTLGYDTYLGLGNGLEERMDFSKRPSSDYDMINVTLDDYINEDKFLTYYITMSGHINYDTTNAIVVKNWEMVKDLPYSKAAKSYLATQIELDKAVEKLINTLENNNKLKDTVIVIVGDHYPYGLNKEEFLELTSYSMLDYDIDRFRMPLIIYNGEDSSNIKVEKTVSSLDVLPTLLNLWGAEYDSRLLMGKDIFSDTESLVIFSDRSFVSGNIIYNSNSEILYKNNEKITDNEYVKSTKQTIYYKYRYSRLILETDYYSTIYSK